MHSTFSCFSVLDEFKAGFLFWIENLLILKMMDLSHFRILQNELLFTWLTSKILIFSLAYAIIVYNSPKI